jgi:hypothetical protein
MSFQFSDQHVKEYHQLGFTILRDLLPASLLRDLRREADKGREIARRVRGDQAQRLQPIANYDEIDMAVFDDFHNLPPLRDALDRLFARDFSVPVDTHATRDVMAILYEPALRPYCTAWHRDWRDNAGGLKLAEWDKVMLDIRYFNQVNCALYDDSSTWVVPGSHLRRDTDGEILRFPERPISGPDLVDKDSEEAELICRDYVTSMPGAFQAHLNAGDYMLYRNSLWHLGNYVPYRKRATIHDGIFSAEFAAFFKNPPMHEPKPNGEPAAMENPNVDTPAYRRWKETVAVTNS